MFLPYSFFLIIYLIGVFILLLFGFFNVYHILRFGMMNRTTAAMMFLFTLFTVATLAISLWYIVQIPWNEGIILEIL